MENDLKEIIAGNLQELRKLNKLTQVELAEKINYSDKAVSRWERAEAMPDVEILCCLAKVFEVTVDYLVTKHQKVEKQVSNHTKQQRINKICITLLATSVVWFVATVIFVSLKLTTGITLWQLFVWSLPASMVVLLVFNSIWGKRVYRFIIISIFIWSLLLAIFLQIGNPRLWIMFFIGLPAQIATLLWAKLRRKTSQK